MDYVYTNARSIIRNWKAQWHKYQNVKSAQNVEKVTGEYPDSDQYVSPNVEIENPKSELELIEESIKNNTPIY